MTRSRVHMLTVAASRIEQDFGNEKLVADLRAAAKLEAARYGEGRAHDDAEQRRIERQRTLFVMLGDTRTIDRLKDAMLQRAYDLMWDGRCTECDAIAEFLPSADVEKMFQAWADDAEGKKPMSAYHGGTL